MKLPKDQSPCSFVEVRFKNSRKDFYRLTENISVQVGDVVIIELERSGYDVGTVSLTGELVRLQMKRKKVAVDSKKENRLVRKANEREIKTWITAREREPDVQKKAREIIVASELQMKLSDVEFQGDGRKATFYYTAPKRVDFRELIKRMATAFSIRVEMRQIGPREEASRLGGIGSCGRELCCSTWLTDFRSVSTNAARYQQLSLNPQMIMGQCGKLKCCLNYELETYQKALKNFPRRDVRLHTEKGVAIFQKADIFKGFLWYCYKNEWATWHKLSVDAVNEIVAKNKSKQAVNSLEDYAVTEEKNSDSLIFEDVAGQDSLNRFDRKKPKNKRFRRNRNKQRRNHA